jgi:predicted nucleic acid-binding protein
MNIVDSSGWLEYFADGPNADNFEPLLQQSKELLVPAITIFEVFKVVCRERGEGQALQAVALMQQGIVSELTASLAMQAAKVSLERKLPLADSIIYTTGLLHNAAIWTQDEHFSGLPNVHYFLKH